MPRQSRGDYASRRRGSGLNEIASLRWSQIWMRGADAVTYAQGQFSQSIDATSKDTLLLSPDGNVVAEGEIAAFENDVRFILPSALVNDALARLRRFVLRVDVTLSVGDSSFGPFETISDLVSSRWPTEYEWSLNLAPHSYGQWVVDRAVSFTKGCFTGQELVGRADARGATMPWRFVGGVCDELANVDASLRGTGPSGPQGVTSWARIGDVLHWRGFAHRTWSDESSNFQTQFMA